MLRGLLTTAWLALGFFVGIPAAMFSAIWLLGLGRRKMRRLLIGLCVAVALAFVFVWLAQPRASAATLAVRPMAAHVVPPLTMPEPDTNDVIVTYCEYCWWCIECWAMPVYQPVTSWEHEQTFNPF